MKAMTHFELREFPEKDPVTGRMRPRRFVCDSEASRVGEVKELVDYLRNIRMAADPGDGDFQWQARTGDMFHAGMFYSGKEADRVIEREIAALESGTQWSQLDVKWRE